MATHAEPALLQTSAALPSAFRDCLAFAAQAGIALPGNPPGPRSSGASCEEFWRLLEAYLGVMRQMASLHLRLAALRAEAEAAPITGPLAVERRTADLRAATATLEGLLGDQQHLVRFLSDSSLKAHLVIEPAGQAAFLQLLQRAGEDGALLRSTREQLQWLARFEHPPTCWDGVLAPLAEAADTCSEYVAQLSTLRAVLARLSEDSATSPGEQPMQHPPGK